MAVARTKLQKSLVGPAGEHYVMYRLHSMGYMATLAPANAPSVDVIVMNPDEKVVANVQVKTRTTGRDKGWHMRDKHEDVVHARLFYAFVDFEEEHPVTHIIPSRKVAEVLKTSHRAWLSEPGRNGRKHKDNAMRRILPDYGWEIAGIRKGWMNWYRERWDYLLKQN